MKCHATGVFLQNGFVEKFWICVLERKKDFTNWKSKWTQDNEFQLKTKTDSIHCCRARGNYWLYKYSNSLVCRFKVFEKLVVLSKFILSLKYFHNPNSLLFFKALTTFFSRFYKQKLYISSYSAVHLDFSKVINVMNVPYQLQHLRIASISRFVGETHKLFISLLSPICKIL